MVFENHPCFNEKARLIYGRLHLPVAVKCNIQCNYCDRKYDCVNESRPGVTSTVLTPEEAFLYARKVIGLNPNIAVTGIAGPGDPFAEPEKTLMTLRLVRNEFPEMLLCTASNGLDLPSYVDDLADLKISHVTVTMNTVRPEIAAKIYAWIRYGKRVYRGLEGAKLLLDRQEEAVRKLKEKRITVKINTILIPGINEDVIEECAETAALWGADILNIMPLYPCKGTVFENIHQPDRVVVHKIKERAAKYLPQMAHCSRCRSDAAGLIGEERKEEFQMMMNEIISRPNLSELKKPYIGVTTMEGLLINQHLGEADEISIYTYNGNHPQLIEKRKTAERGQGDKRWEELANRLSDCHTLLVQGAGNNPINILGKKGIRVLITSGVITEVLSDFFAGRKLYRFNTAPSCGKGLTCSGTGTGCG